LWDHGEARRLDAGCHLEPDADEYVLRWLPAGTHDWNRFVRPADLRRLLEEAGLTVTSLQGVAFDPLRWDWRLSPDTDVNYMMVAEKRLR
jgi:2-polyprenyl-6-hydroxyphenyl methylase/3-demethylubiquinone-9 3-methyltransferase